MEREALLAELSRAVGLGGRDRRPAPPRSERAPQSARPSPRPWPGWSDTTPRPDGCSGRWCTQAPSAATSPTPPAPSVGYWIRRVAHDTWTVVRATRDLRRRLLVQRACVATVAAACHRPRVGRVGTRRGGRADVRARPASSRRSRHPATRRTCTSTPTAGCTPAATSTPATLPRRRSSSGTRRAGCCAPGRFPGRLLDEDHGVQVAQQTYDGKLVVLETSTGRSSPSTRRPGGGSRVATFPAGATPNYATWGPGGALFVTDYSRA